MSQPQQSAQLDPFKHRAFWITSAVLLALFLLSVYVVLPRNVLSSTALESIKPVVNTAWPQGWGFFTKDPDSPTMDAYTQGPDGRSLLVTPQTRDTNVFGLSRAARAQGPELAILNSFLDKTDWIECGRAGAACAAEAWRAEPKSVRNSSPVPTICGDVLLTMEKATPWAYRDLVPEKYRILQSAHLSVECDHGSNK